MSVVGKIKTLFSDKEKTEALFPRTKISAVSDNDGVGLNILLDKKVSKTLVWENVSYNSSFAAQTLSIDLTPYDGIEIMWQDWADKTDYLLNGALYYPGTTDTYTALIVRSYNLMSKRAFKMSASGIQFYDAIRFVPGGTASTDDSYAIPRKIFGVKGVQ